MPQIYSTALSMSYDLSGKIVKKIAAMACRKKNHPKYCFFKKKDQLNIGLFNYFIM
jgi:hypothetical protein